MLVIMDMLINIKTRVNLIQKRNGFEIGRSKAHAQEIAQSISLQQVGEIGGMSCL